MGEYKAKSGYVYVVTNDSLRLVQAKGRYKGRKVQAVKIGNAKDFTNRLGSLNTGVYENFELHLAIKTEDVVALEGIIHGALQDYRIDTKEGDLTEFFACPLDEVIRRIKGLIGRGHMDDVEEFKGGRVIGRSGAKIRSNLEKQKAALQAKRDAVQKVAKNPGKSKRRAVVGKSERAAPFSFEALGVAIATRLVFIPTGVVVNVADGRHVVYRGKKYSLSGFCKMFMPIDKRNSSGAYRGPDFFSLDGTALSDYRRNVEGKGIRLTMPVSGNEKTAYGEVWKGKTQLAKALARRGGNEGAYGGILHYFSKRKPCSRASKWRPILTDAGMKFDGRDYLIDWTVAKNPL